MSSAPQWVQPGGQQALDLYAEAEALGASTVTLSSQSSAQKFIDTKKASSSSDVADLIDKVQQMEVTQRKQSQELEEQSVQLEQSKVSQFPALRLFTGFSGCGSHRLTESVKEATLTSAGSRCRMCRRGRYRIPNQKRKGQFINVPISTAHIVPGDPEELKQWQKLKEGLDDINPPFYKTKYEFESVRNTIALCGSKDVIGTCHWAYDNHYVGIIYCPLRQVPGYDMQWFIPEAKQQTGVGIHTTVEASGWDPYRRGLALHALEGARRSGFAVERVHNLLTRARLASANEEQKQEDSDNDFADA